MSTLWYQAYFEEQQIWCQLAQPLTILRRTRCSALTRRCSAGLSCVVVRPFVIISLGLSFSFRTSRLFPGGMWSPWTLPASWCQEFSGSSQSCTNFECTVQLVVGFSSTHLPLRAERIWIGQQIVFSPFGFTRKRSTQISKCMKHLACDDRFAAQEGVFEPDVCR